VAELVDAADSKSVVRRTWEFESPRGHHCYFPMSKKFFEKNNHHHRTAVLILGGGLVGGLLAVSLKKNNIPFVMVDNDCPQHMLDIVHDGRTTAISLGSVNIFKNLNLWKHDLAAKACPIHKIQVYEKDSFCSLQFDHEDVGQDPMGYIVENYYIRQAILNEIQDHPTCFYQTSVINIIKHPTYVECELSNGEIIHASLLVSAEGRKSSSRELMAPKIRSRDYAQQALVVHLSHEKNHNYRAFEVFTENGPFAILPLQDLENKKSGVVFAKPSNFDWNGTTDFMIEEEIKKIFPFYGDLKIISKRWYFPLSVFEVDRLVKDRQVLVGDAAHGMHPLAGQGVNLGWRDVDVLSTLIVKNFKLGIDIGSSFVLSQYEKSRKRDIKTLLMTTDFMNQIFEHRSKTVYFLRNAGISLINRITPVRRFLMKKAMGI
jgi:2-octaprenyl-6-methoxyphenol hydroxylase